MGLSTMRVRKEVLGPRHIRFTDNQVCGLCHLQCVHVHSVLYTAQLHSMLLAEQVPSVLTPVQNSCAQDLFLTARRANGAQFWCS